jgi:hypothetical protein
LFNFVELFLLIIMPLFRAGSFGLATQQRHVM